MGGGASSKVSAMSITRQLMSVMTSIATDAGSRTTSTNQFLTDGCDLRNVEINQTNSVFVDTNVVQTLSAGTETSNLMDQQVQQIAEAEAPNLNLGGRANAETFTSLIQDVSTAIVSNISASCSQAGTQTNAIDCRNSTFDTVCITQEVLGEYLFDCVQDASAVTEAEQELQNFIDQQSSAKVTSSESVIIIVVIIIVILAGIFLWVWKNKPEFIPGTAEHKQKAALAKQKADEPVSVEMSKINPP